MDIEAWIFELMGREAVGAKVVDAIVAEFALDRATALDLYVKVRTERGSPSRVATREAVERMRWIRSLAR